MCFFNRGDTEGTNSSKMFPMFVYVFVLCKFVSCLLLWFVDDLWFDDLRAEKIGDGLNIVFSHGVTLCG